MTYKKSTTMNRRQELRELSAQAVLDLLAAGTPLHRISVPMIAACVGFTPVYISTRVGLQDAIEHAIKLGLAEKHPALMAQLALQGDRRAKRFTAKELTSAFQRAIAQ